METADMVIRLEMANSAFHTTGRLTIVVNDMEPALILPPTFVCQLRKSLRDNGVILEGAIRTRAGYQVHTSAGVISMRKTFSVNDVINKLIK